MQPFFSATGLVIKVWYAWVCNAFKQNNMKKLIASEINNGFPVRARRWFMVLFSLFIIPVVSLVAQPVWNSVPTVTPQPISLQLAFNLDRASYVYYFVIPGDYAIQTGATVKDYAQRALPYGAIVANDRITYASGNYSTQIWGELANLMPGTQYTIQIVAESQTVPNVFTAVSKIVFFTLPCPDVYFVNALQQTIKCVNKTATAIFNMIPDPDPNVSGILKGTTWVINWGDGTTYNYTSLSDGDYPSLANRTHTYSSATDCNYVFSCGVKNPCGKTFSPQYVAVVHGRDIPSDGDGELEIVNNADGSNVIQVCAGTETTITVRDNSTWNCQNPTVPGGLTAVPNLDPRNIEWLYGRDPGGAITNTITGPVAVAGLGFAPQASGRISPSPYGPTSLARAVTIPATCQAGQYFRIYLKNWNKCNWTDPEYVYTYVDIVVIAAPPAPTVPNKEICFGGNRTLTVTSTPVGILRWYSDAGLTNVVASNTATYTPSYTGPGNISFWVTDQSNTGLLCMSPATQVTLTIDPLITNNTISANQTICYNTIPAQLTGSSPGGGTGTYSYQWQISTDNSSWNNIGGATSQNYTPGALTANRYFRRVVTSGPCSNNSSSVLITVRPTPTATIAGTTSACQGGASPNIRFTNPQPIPVTITYRINAGADLTVNVGASTYTDVYAPTSTPGTFIYSLVNVYYQTAPSCLNNISGSATITVRPTPTATISGTTTVCQGASSPTVTITNPQTLAVRVTYNINGSGTTTVTISGSSTYNINAPTGTAGTFNYNLTSIRYDANPACTNAITGTATITVRPSPAATITGSTTVCQNGASPNLTFTNSTSIPITVTYNINGSGSYTIPIGASGTRTEAVPTGTAGSFTYNLVSAEYQNAPSCPASISGSATVVVRPTPTATISGTTAVCQNAVSPNVTFTNPQTIPITVTYNINGSGSYNVNVPASSTATVAAPTGTAGSFAYNLVSVVYQTAPACSNAITGNATITVNPAPTPSIGGLNDVCAGQSGVIYTTTNNPPNTYVWAISGGVITAGAGTNSITVTWGAAGAGWVRVTETNATPCSTTTANYNVTIRPGAPGSAPSIVTAPTDICRDGTINIDVTDVANANSYIWDYSWVAGTNNATTAVSQISIDLTGVPVGTHTVTVQAVNGCGSSPWMPVHTFDINDIPDLAAASANPCSDVATGITMSITNAGPYCSGITYNITAINNGGLTASAGNPLTGAGQAANAIADDAWTNTTGADVNVVYTVIPQSAEGCSGSPETITVTVKSEPRGWNATASTCSDVAFSYNIQTANINTAPGNSQLSTFTWQAADNPNVTGETTALQNSGTISDVLNNVSGIDQVVVYTIVPTGTNGCTGNSFTLSVTVRSEPVGWNASTSTCSDVALNYNLQTSVINVAPGNSQASNFSWVAAANPNVSGESTTPQAGNTINNTLNNVSGVDQTVIYTVTPTGTNGCAGNSFTVSVTVRSEPLGQTGSTSTCSDVALNYDIQALNLNVAPGNGQASTFSWVAAPNANVTGESTTAVNGGIINDNINNVSGSDQNVIYTVTPTGTNGCTGNTFQVTATIRSEPRGQNVTLSTCSDVALNYNLQTSNINVAPGNSQLSTFVWQAADNPNVTGESLTPQNTGSITDNLNNVTGSDQTVVYTVVPTGTNGCTGNSFTVTVTVKPEPVITPGQDVPVCSGNAMNYEIDLSNFGSPAANGVTFTWNTPTLNPVNPLFTGGSARLVASSANITDTYTNTMGGLGIATYAITPYRDGCTGNTVNLTATVGAEPVLANLDKFVCSGQPITLTLHEAAGSVTPSYYNITGKTLSGSLTDAGNAALPNATAPANYIFNDTYTNTSAVNQTVTYHVQPILAPDCYGDPVDVVITIRPPVLPGSLTGNTSICYGTDAPVISNVVAASGGDGNITYSWYYSENLAATPGDANWTLIPTATGVSYDPGILFNPTKFFRKAVDGSCPGEVYTNAITININPLPVTGAISGPPLLCEDATNQVYQVPSTPGSTYQWTVPGSLNRTSPQGLYFIIVDAVPGMATPFDTVSVVETFSSTTGCVGKPVKFPVTVVEEIPGVLVNGPSSVCKGDTGIYSVPYNAASSYSWSIPAGAFISSDPDSSTISVVFNMALSGQVSVVEVTSGVCTTTHLPRVVTVNPLPTVFNLTSPLAYCSGDPGVTLTLSGSENNVNYQLFNSGGMDGGPLAGNGAALQWINKTTETYHVVATNAITGCVQQMNGVAVPTINFVDGGTIGIDQAVCENTAPAAFTSITPATGGGTLTYQWQNSTDGVTFNNIAGATSAVYASGPIAVNTYFRRLAASTLGTSICTDPSDTLLVTAIIFNPGSIGTDQAVCEGTAPAGAFTSVAPSGTGTFTYQWKQSTDGVNFTNIPGAESETYTAGALSVDTWFKREVTSTYMGKACVKETNPVKVTVINFAPGSIGSDQTICYNTAPAAFTSVAASGDGSFLYSWESSPTGAAPWTALGVSTPTYTSPALTTDTYFRRAVTSTVDGQSCTQYSNIIRVTVNDFDPGTIGSPQTICEGTAPAAFTSVAPSGDPAATFTYQWQNSTDGVNFSSISGATNATYTSGNLSVDTYFRRQVTATLNGRACIEVTPAILVTVNNMTPGSIGTAQTICEGVVPATLTETGAPTLDGIISYQWQESPDGTSWADVPSGGTNATYDPPALTADRWYKRLVTSTLGTNTCTEESNVVKITVNNFNPGNIAADQTICENTAPAAFTSTAPSGDGTFSYRWFFSTDGTTFNQVGGALSQTYSPGLLIQDTWYFREVTSTLGINTCIKRTDTLLVTVNNLDPGAITGDQTICEGAVPSIAFGSTLPTADGGVSYEWRQSTDGIVFTPIPGSNVEIYSPPALNADTWYKRAVSSTIGGNTCTEETNFIKVTVINFSPGSIASNQTICEGTAPAPFTSVAASGDGTKTYQWENSTDGVAFNPIIGATSATFTSPALSVNTWFRRLSTATLPGGSCTEITDTILVTVIIFDPGTIGSAQTICEGSSPAAFTEVTPASGNGTFTYQWQSSLDNVTFTSITGATNATYTAGPLTQDTWFRRQVTSTLNGRSCTEYTPSILVTVNNLTPGSIAGAQTICEGDTPAAFTESGAATYDGIVTYQWQQSPDNSAWANVPSGGTGATYTPGPLTADTWFKRLVISTIGGNICTEETNVIKVTVNNFNPGSIASDQTICENTAASPLTSVTPTGDGTFSYKWLSSADGINFSQIGGALSEMYSPGILSADTWYQRVVTSTLSGNACVDSTNIVKVTVNNLEPGSISADQDICENGDPAPFTSVAPTYDGALSYMWQSSSDGLNFTDLGVTTETYDSPALSADTWFRRSVTSTIGLNACTEYTNMVKVTVINFSPGSIGSDQTICENTVPAAFTSVAASGDGAKSYQWENSLDGITFNPIVGAINATYASPALIQDTWFRRLSTATAGLTSCTEITDTVKVTVINFDPGTISSPQTICEDSAPAAFTSVDASGDGVITYQWLASLDGTSFSNVTGATNPTYTSGTLTADTWFRRQATSSLNGRQCTEYAPDILVTVNNLTPGSISGTQTICEGGIPAAFTSAPANGDGTITYQWQESIDGTNWNNVAAGGNVEIYVAPALTSDRWYKRIATSTLPGSVCAEESNTIKVTVNNFDPGNIAADQTICENTAPAPLTSVTPTGDGIFTYKWYRSTDGTSFAVIGTAISETYSPGLLTQDTWYYREVTSTLGTNTCVERTDTVLITVNNFVPGVIAGTTTICENTAPPAFTVTTPASGDGGIITYQWQDSPDGISFTDIPGATADTYAPPALSADTWYKRLVTSTLNGNPCTEETNILRVTVINFAPGSIGSDQTICENTAPAPFTSVAASGDGSKTYQWENSTDGINFTAVPGATFATYTSPALIQDTWFRRLATATVNGVPCTEISDTILVTVNNFDPGTISAAQTICAGDIPVPFTSVAPSGDGTFTFQWQSSSDGVSFSSISGATAATYAPDALNVDTWFRRQVTSELNSMSCIEYTPSVKITVNNLQPGTIGGAQTICEGSIPTPLTSVAATGDGTITYQWQESTDNGLTWANVSSGGNGATYAPPALTADMWYKRIATSDVGGQLCPAESNTIKITVVNFDPGSIAADQTICEGSAPAAFTSVSPSGDGSFTYRWFRSIDGSSFAVIGTAVSETYSPGTLTQDTWYYREVTATVGATSCVANTDTIRITVNNFNPGSINADQTVCEGEDPGVINSVDPSGDGSFSYQWYESYDGTVYTPIAGATASTYDPGILAVDTWFRRAVTSSLNGNTCTEETNAVRISVINFNPGTIGIDQTICENNAPATFTGTAPSGDGAFTYSWEYSLDSITWVPIGGASSATYTSPAISADTWFRRSVTATLNSHSCSEMTPPVKVTVNNFDPQSVAADQTVCEGVAPAAFTSVTPTGDGTFTYQWQSSLDGATFSNITGATSETFAAGALLIDTWYRRQVTSTLNGNTCTEATPSIKVTVNNVTAGSIGSAQTVCEGETPAPLTSVAPTFDGTVSYEWQSSPDGTSFTPIAGATLETYAPPALFADTWYKRIVTSTLPGSACSRESNVIKITVNNYTPGSVSADQTICENTAPVTFTSVTPSGDGTFGYRWLGSPDGITFTAIPGAINETYNPGSLAADMWYSREVTSTYAGKSCADTTNVVRVTVINFNQGSIGTDQTICEGGDPDALTSVTPTGDGAVGYQWKSSTDGVNYLNISGATSETYDPGVLTQDTWYIRSVSFSLNGTTCTKETNAVRIYVNNVNPGTIISDQTICNGSDPVAFFSIVHGTGDGTVTWQWMESSDGTTFTPIAGATLLNYDAPPLTADTWYRRATISDLNGQVCTRETNIVRVTVNAVQGGTIASDQTICYGSTPAPLTSTNDGSGTGTVTYQWMRSPDGVLWNTIAGQTGVTYTPGVHYMDTWYKRVLTSIQNGVLCQAESNPVKITVNPLPVAILSGGATICPGEPAILKVNLPIGTGPFTLNILGHGVVNNYNSDDDILVYPGATTTYSLVSVTDANTCTSNVGPNLMGTATVTVQVLPVIGLPQPQDRTICEYGVTSFTVTTSAGTGLTYQWMIDSTGVFEPLSDGGVYYGATTSTLSIFGGTREMSGFRFRADVTGCGTTVSSNPAVLTVNTVPEIINQPKDSTICETQNASFTVNATGTNITFKWRVKTGAAPFTDVTDGGIYSGATTSTLNLTGVPYSMNNSIFVVIVSGDCGSPVYSNYVILRVNRPPAVFTQPKNASVCDGGGPVYFFSNGTGMIDSLRWQVSTDNGGTWNDIYDNAMYSGTTSQQLALIDVPISYHNYQYRLALKAFCANTYSNGAVLTVNSLPSISWASDPLPACGNVTLPIITTVSGGSGSWTQHTWTGDVGPLNNYFVQNPDFKSLLGGTYKLYYKVRDSFGCVGEDSVSVVVDAPDATFTQDVNMGCTPATVNFSIPDITGFTGWTWDFGDGSPVNTTDQNVTHIFTNTTPSTILYRTVRLTVTSTSGCTDSKTSMMTVYPAVNATFTASDDTVCSGSQLIFTANPGANMYTWNYGDGMAGPGGSAVQHMYTNTTGSPVPMTVQLITSSYYGCTDTMEMDIVVMPMPVAQFSANPATQNFLPAGNPVSFTDETTPLSTLWTYTWNFGDSGNSAQQNPSHTYTGIGTYDVTMRVTNGKCSSQISHPVTILPPPPTAMFDSIPDGCAPLYVEITNTSINRDVPGTTFRWDFGDGGASTAENPTYTYFTPGIYKVTLTVYGPGGTSTYYRTVEAFPSPQAYFEVAPAKVLVNDERVRCFNLTTGADAYLWDFGDGDTSRLREPYHKYMEEGIYDITLWAYSNNGCSDMFVLSPAVTVEPPGQIRFATVFMPNKTGEENIDVSDINAENMDRFFYPPIKEKVINYKLQIFNRQGMLIFQSDNINKPWNGYYKGKLCPQGVYVWYVEGKYVNGKPFKQVGDITLLH